MLQVKQLMTGKLEIIQPNDSINSAAEKMRNSDIGSLPVVENNQVVGMLTDRDITIRVVAEGGDPTKTTVRDVMTTNVESVHEDSDVSEVTRLMKDRRVRRVVVLNHDNKPTGICSLVDLAMSTDEQTTGEVVKGMSQGKKH